MLKHGVRGFCYSTAITLPQSGEKQNDDCASYRIAIALVAPCERAVWQPSNDDVARQLATALDVFAGKGEPQAVLLVWVMVEEIAVAIVKGLLQSVRLAAPREGVAFVREGVYTMHVSLL